MRLQVRIEHVWTGEVWVLEGTAKQVRAEVLLLFPWLRVSAPDDLEAVLEDLASQQAVIVEVRWVDG